MAGASPPSTARVIATAAGGLLAASALTVLLGKLLNNFPLAPGVCITAYSPGGHLANAWGRARKVCEYVRPEIVQLHSHFQGTQGIGEVAKMIRSDLPGVRIWLGVATNPAIAHGAAAAIETAARAVDDANVETVCWNAESTFKTHPLSIGAGIAREIVEGFHRRYPKTIQGHTAYAQPTLHMDYPWSAWLGGHQPGTGTYAAESSARYSLPQVYPFDGHQPAGPIAPGRFPATFQHHLTSWAIAVRDGVILPSVGVGLYVPGEHILTRELVTACKNYPINAFWPWDDPPFSGFDETVIAAALELTGHGP